MARVRTVASPRLETDKKSGIRVPASVVKTFSARARTGDDLSMMFLAGASTFVTWYSWRDVYALIFFAIPFIFLWRSHVEKCDKRDVALFGWLLATFILDVRYLLNFFNSPTIFPMSVLLTYIINREKKLLINYLIVLATLYSLIFSFHITNYLIPELASILPTVFQGTVEIDTPLFSRALDLNYFYPMWSIFWNGVYQYLSTFILLLSLVSFVELRKWRENLLVFVFPLAQALLFSLFVRELDAFQGRFIVSSSIFLIILAASGIFAILDPIIASIDHVRKKLVIGRHNFSFSRRKFKLIALCVLLFVGIYQFSHHIYGQGIEEMKSWDYRSELGWSQAIEWIETNTSPDDILVARFANYWAWYTDRKTVALSPSIFSPSMNETELTSVIALYGGNYLVVDLSFQVYFSNLLHLYNHPDEFDGAEVAFQSTNENGYKVVIYNFTSIL